MTAPKADGPATGSIPRPTLTGDDARALERFAQHCDAKADRARRLDQVATWRTTARLARLYVRGNS